jgi:hypothetical protein
MTESKSTAYCNDSLTSTPLHSSAGAYFNKTTLMVTRESTAAFSAGGPCSNAKVTLREYFYIDLANQSCQFNYRPRRERTGPNASDMMDHVDKQPCEATFPGQTMTPKIAQGPATAPNEAMLLQRRSPPALEPGPPPPAAQSAPPPPPVVSPAADCQFAETHWKTAEVIKTLAIYQDHLARFPTCAFAGLAKARIEALSKAGPPRVVVAVNPAPSDADKQRAGGNLDIPEQFGLQLADMSSLWRLRFKIKDAVAGVVVTGIDANAPADRVLVPGDVVVEIDGTRVATEADLRRRFDASRNRGANKIDLTVSNPNGERRPVSLSLK